MRARAELRLALAARGEDHLLARGAVGQLVERPQEALGDVKVAEVRGQGDVPLHAHAERVPPGARSRAARFNTCWMRWMCEANVATMTRPGARATCSASAAPTSLSERVCPGRSTLVESEQSTSDAALPQLGERSIVGGLAVERARIELEVAGVHDGAGRRLDGESDAVDDRMRHPDRLDREWTDGDPVPRAHRPQIGVQDAVLAQLARRPAPGSWASRTPAPGARAADRAARRCGPRAHGSGTPRGSPSPLASAYVKSGIT